MLKSDAFIGTLFFSKIFGTYQKNHYICNDYEDKVYDDRAQTTVYAGY